MMPQPPQTCPNCGEPVPPNARLCPNCGAALTNVPPVPMLGMNPPAQQLVEDVLWTGSRKGDVTVGIVLGIFAPMVIPLLITALYYMNAQAIAGAFIMLLGTFGQLVLPLVAAYLLRKKYRVAGDAMMKTLLFLVLFGILIAVGAFVVCLLMLAKKP